MEQLKDHISTLTIPNTVRIVELVDTFRAFIEKKGNSLILVVVVVG